MELDAIADKIMNHIDQYIEFKKHYILIRPSFDVKDKIDKEEPFKYAIIRYQFIDNFYSKYENNRLEINIESTDGSIYEFSFGITTMIGLLSNEEINKVVRIIDEKFINKIIPFVDKSMDILSEIHDKLEALVFAPDSSFFKEFMAARVAKQ